MKRKKPVKVQMQQLTKESFERVALVIDATEPRNYVSKALKQQLDKLQTDEERQAVFKVVYAQTYEFMMLVQMALNSNRTLNEIQEAIQNTVTKK